MFGNIAALRPCPRPAPGPRIGIRGDVPSPGRRWKANIRHPRHRSGIYRVGGATLCPALSHATCGLTIIQPTAEKRTGNVSTRSRSAFGKSPAMGEDANWRPPSVSSGEVESDDRYYIIPADQVIEVMANGRYDLVPFY